MGIPGIICFVAVLSRIGRRLWAYSQVEKDSEVATAGALGFAIITVCIVAIPSGSPFLGIPTGVLSWLIIGSVFRISEKTELADRPRSVRLRYGKL